MDLELRSLVYDGNSCHLKGMTLTIRLDSFLFFIFQRSLCVPNTSWYEEMLENCDDFWLSGSSKQHPSKRFLMHSHAKRNRCCHGKNRQKERTIVYNQPHSSQAPLLSYFMEYYIPKVFSSRLSAKFFLHRRSEQRQKTMIHITFCSDLQAWRHFFYLK